MFIRESLFVSKHIKQLQIRLKKYEKKDFTNEVTACIQNNMMQEYYFKSIDFNIGMQSTLPIQIDAL